MHPKLAAKFPEIKTWHGLCIEDGISAIAITISPEGLRAMIIDENFKRSFIEPLNETLSSTYLLYYEAKTDQQECKSVEDVMGYTALEHGQIAKTGTTNNPGALGDRLRTHRLAMAASGEFTQANGGTVASASAAITNIVNIQNLLYIREFSINFQLVANNNLIIYTNAATDPFANTVNPEPDLTNAQNTIDNVIGNANYDVGHLMKTQGGWATLNVPCVNASKGRGNSFGIRAVNHEMGHQFGCTHTTDVGSIHRYDEIAIGNTVMGRNDDLGNDDYFHIHSTLQVAAHIEQPGYCVPGTVTNNTIPTVTVGTGGMFIPKSTPFQLSGSAYDPDPNTTLLYNWQQYNNGGSTSVVNGMSVPAGDYPVFRNFFPTPEGNVRTLPKLADIINNTSTTIIRNNVTYKQEDLPSYSRNLTFRLVARDYELSGGATDYNELSFQVDGNSGPFLVTSPNLGTEVWTSGTNVTVTWSVAGTNVAPVSCATVDIKLSVDGGWTYPYTLVTATANDGTQTFTLPAGISQTSLARVRVECASYNNVRFFDISNANFTINSSCTAFGGIIIPSDNVTAPSGSALLDLNLTPNYSNLLPENSYTAQVVSTDPKGLNAEFNLAMTSCAAGGTMHHYKTSQIQVDRTGTYTMSVNFVGGLFRGFFALYNTNYNPAAPCTGFITSNTVAGPTQTTSVSATLTVGVTYTMVFHTWFDQIPATCTVKFNSSNNGKVFSVGAQTPPGNTYTYTYAAVNIATNVITAINASADFKTLPGGTYNIYGLSYKSSSAPPTIVEPAIFVNQNFTQVQNNGQCASFSFNFVRMKVQACNLIAVLPISSTACNPATGTYSQTLKVIYENQPPTGSLTINGQNFPITGSPQFVTLTNLNATGEPVDITASFTASPTCQFLATDCFTGPAADKIAGTALNFEGAENEYVNLDGVSANTTTLTLMAWVKPTGTQNQYTGIIFSNADQTGLNFYSGNQLGFHWNGSEWFWASGLVVPAGEWSHVAMVANGTNVVLYVNGVAAPRNFTLTATNFTNVQLGTYKGWSDRNYRGLLEDVRILNTALTQQQIREQMHIVPSVCNANLLAYYQFNESIGAVDKTGKTTASFVGNLTKATSQAPVAAGTAVTKTITAAGLVDFNTNADANLKINFTGTPPNGDVVVSYLTSEGPHGTVASANPLSPAYWIVRNYGTSNTGLNASMTFQQAGFVTTSNGPDYKLYKRGSNATGTWDAPITANAANAGLGEVTFPGITSFSQFIIDRNPTAPVCAITAITAGTQTTCVPATNTYTQQVTVTFANAPATGNLVVNGQNFTIGTSPQTVTLTGLTANGNPVNVTANFSALPSCTFTANALFTAPVGCQASTCTTYNNTTPVQIPATPPTTITSTINVPTGGTISDVNITLVGTHTYVSDLVFTLQSPSGTTVTLIANQCTSNDDFNIKLDDQAANALTCPINAGNTQRPQNPLSAFNNQNPAGNWILTINDLADEDGGQLTSWMLEICRTGGTNCTTPPPATGTIAAGTYQVNGTISTAGQVLSPSNVVLKASTSVVLTAGFHARAGSTFRAAIEGCSSMIDEQIGSRSTDYQPSISKKSSENLAVHPNPFTAQTTINYTLSKDTEVNIVIYDMQGKQIAQPIKQVVQAAGEYSLVFDAQNRPKGIYMVILQTKSKVLSQKIVLIE